MRLKFVSLLLVLYTGALTCSDSFYMREANLDDIELLVDTHYRSWHEAYDSILYHEYCLKYTYEKFTRYWKKFFNHKNNSFALAAWEGSTIVGFIAAGPIKSFEEECCTFSPRDGEIYKLYVLPNKQGIGIGKALLRACLDRLCLERYTNIVVRAFEKNKRACSFYENHGACLLRHITYWPLLPYYIYAFA